MCDVADAYISWKLQVRMFSRNKLGGAMIYLFPSSQEPNPVMFLLVQSPRRDCCRVVPTRKRSVLYIRVGNCHLGEVSEL